MQCWTLSRCSNCCTTFGYMVVLSISKGRMSFLAPTRISTGSNKLNWQVPTFYGITDNKLPEKYVRMFNRQCTAGSVRVIHTVLRHKSPRSTAEWVNETVRNNIQLIETTTTTQNLYRNKNKMDDCPLLFNDAMQFCFTGSFCDFRQ